MPKIKLKSKVLNQTEKNIKIVNEKISDLKKAELTEKAGEIEKGDVLKNLEKIKNGLK